MRLVWGPPPEDVGFTPEADGWQPLREPTPLFVSLVGSAFGLPLALLVGRAWRACLHGAAPSFHFQLPLTGTAARMALAILPLVAFPVAFVLLIVVHELCHAVVYPRCGLTRDTQIGVWPAKLLCYACHTGAITRERMLLCFAMPFAVVTGLPLGVCALVGHAALPAMVGSTANALFSGGDLLGALLLWRQVPRGALVRNKGWATWWRVPAPAAE
jgi:hypothetical protein